MSRADGNFDPIEAVRAFLEEARCDSQIKRTEATIFTVSDASAAVGAPEEEILKSILLRVNHGKSYALALMSGVNKVDTSFAGAEECEEWSGFRPGGVPPVGYPEQPQTLLDEDLFSYGTVWAAAGTDHAFFPVAPDELLRITGGEKSDIKKA